MYSARMNNTTLHYVAQDKIVKVIIQTPAKKHLIAESVTLLQTWASTSTGDQYSTITCRLNL